LHEHIAFLCNAPGSRVEKSLTQNPGNTQLKLVAVEEEWCEHFVDWSIFPAF